MHTFMSSTDFFSAKLFKKIFQEYHQSVEQFGPKSGLTFVRPDLGPNCLHRLSADDTSEQIGVIINKFHIYFYYRFEMAIKEMIVSL